MLMGDAATAATVPAAAVTGDDRATMEEEDPVIGGETTISL